MKLYIKIFSFLILLSGYSFPQFTEFHPELDWYTIKGEYVEVHYHEGAERTARVVAKIGDEIWEPICSLYGYEPDDVHYVIKDIDDYSNGATYFFDNKIEIWTSALDFDLRGTHNWLRNVISHEFTHLVQIQASMKSSRALPAVFLQVLNYEDERRPDILYGFPNVLISYPLATINVPAWFAEGTAQYMRKEFDYDQWDTHRDMILRSYALDGNMLTWNEMGVFGKTSLGNESVYNSGYALTRYIAQKYGEDKLAEISRALGNFWNFTIDAAFEDALGKSGNELYHEWRDFVTKSYIERTTDLRTNLVTGDTLAKEGFGNFYPVFNEDGSKFVYISNKTSDYFGLSGIYLYDFATKEEKLLVSNVRSTIDWVPGQNPANGTGKIIYSKLSDDNPDWVNVHDLYVYDIDEEEETRLTYNLRANQPDISNDGKKIVFLFQKDGTTNLGTVDVDHLKETYITTNNLLGTSFIDMNNGIVVGEDGIILKTTNSGISWDPKTSNINGQLHSVSFSDSENGFAVGMNGVIYRTKDGGESWTSNSGGTENTLYGVSFSDLDNGIAVGENGTILKTTNGGENWTIKSGGTENTLYGVSFSDLDNGIAVGENGAILKTTDGGENWTSKSGGTGNTLYGVSFGDIHNGITVGENGTILKTTDGGENWTSKSGGTGNTLFSVSFSDVDNGIAVGENGTILKSTDGGIKWISQLSGTTNDLYGVTLSDLSNGNVIGENGTILRTMDGGKSWISNFNQLTSFNNGEQVYNPKFSNDDSYIIFGYSYHHTRDIAKINPDGTGYEEIISTKSDERNPVIDKDGNLIYSSDETGIFNVYKYDFTTKQKTQLTNVLGGSFMPSVSTNGDILYAGYTSTGYKIFHVIPEKQEKVIAGKNYIWKNNPPLDVYSANGDVAALNINRLRNFNDYETPDYDETKYGGVFSKLTFFPFIRYDNYNTSNKFAEKIKPGLLVTSSDMLNRYALFAGGSINSRLERDLFLIFDYRNKLPLLFDLGIKPELALELYNISRKADVDIYFTPDSTGQQVTYQDTIPTSVTYNLFEVDFVAKHRIFSRNQELEFRFIFSRYSASLEAFFLPNNLGLYPTTDDTYLIGRNFQLKYTLNAMLPYRDAEINPVGVQLDLTYNYELNKFNSEGEYVVEDGLLKPSYNDFNFHRVELNSKLHFPLWANHTLTAQLRGGSILGPAVPDFFDFYLGGLIGMKAYPFYAISGNELTWLNLTYRFPLFRNIDARAGHLYLDKIYFSVYGDLGNAWTGDFPDLNTFKKGAGAELRIQMSSYYLFPTSLFFNAAYGFDKFDRTVNNEKITYGKEWQFYGGVLFGFDF